MAEDLPLIIYWRTSTGVVLTTLLRPLATDDHYKRAILRRWVPYAAVGWRIDPDSEWAPMSQLPKTWGLRLRRHGEHLELTEQEQEALDEQFRQGR